jgi:hypothetical protein
LRIIIHDNPKESGTINKKKVRRKVKNLMQNSQQTSSKPHKQNQIKMVNLMNLNVMLTGKSDEEELGKKSVYLPSCPN